jgi:exosortase/archaeosortase family protein
MTAALSPAGARVPRAVGLTLAGIVAAVNMNAAYIIGSVQLHGLAIAATNLFGLNAAMLFALYGLWEIGQKDTGNAAAAPVSRSDMLVIAAALGLSLIPWNAASLVALLGLALWCIFTGATETAERRAGLIMLAMGGSILIARLLLNSVGDRVVNLDAQFVGWLAGVAVEDNVVDFRNFGARSFIIGLGCSSVHNMSQAVLLWATATQLLRLKIDAPLVLFALLAMAGMFLVNAARLTAIAWYPQHFDTIHQGWIAELFGLISLIVAALIIAAGALHAHRRQA